MARLLAARGGYERITELNLSIGAISDSDDIDSLIQHTSQLRNLAHLDISWNSTSQENLFKILESLGGCPTLLTINLEHSKLTDLAILTEILSSFPNLECVNLAGHHLREAATLPLLKMIERCPNLKLIGLDRSHLDLGEKAYKNLADGTREMGREVHVIHKFQGSSANLCGARVGDRIVGEFSEEFEELLRRGSAEGAILVDSDLGAGIPTASQQRDAHQQHTQLSAKEIKRLLREKPNQKQTTL